MKKAKKVSGKRNKGFTTINKKKKLKASQQQTLNKKSIFNRYKNKQRFEEDLTRKKYFDRKLQANLVTYSDSEEEENVYGQLVSCFTKTVQGSNTANSEDDDENSDSEHESPSTNANLSAPREIDQSGTESENSESLDQLIELNNEELEEEDDPFTKHLQNELANELLVSLNNKPPYIQQTTLSWPALGNLCISIPKSLDIKAKTNKSKFSLIEEKAFAAVGSVPNLNQNVDFNKLHIKSQIQGNVVSANKANLIKRDLELSDIFTPLQKELFSIMNNYQDLLYPERTFSNADEIRYIYVLHVVNHLIKTRTKILHHNAKLSKKSDVSDEYRDQGLVRPKVLIMVPFKDSAYRVVKTLIDILVPKEAGQVVNKKRFEDEFTGGELALPKKNPKPEDYELLFSGNTDDTVRIGMTVTKKTLKLYTDFYSSDILIASPLGLRMIIGAEGEEERDYDFLSSIEVLIMDQTDVFFMQNWDHVLHVFDHLHLQPKKTHGTDFSRIRSWAVNGWSKYYRQTLIFSSVMLPEIKSVINKKCQNYAGKVITMNHIETGCIQQVLLQVPQIFHRFNADNPLAAADARFDYFIKEVLPKQKDSLMSHTLIYVPSYFDYVRIRNYFKKEDISFVQICEYSKEGKIARARDMFFHTEAHFLLYSERVHFFRRFRIKGIRHIIFYQPPTYPHFYSEMCNLMQESNQNKYGGSASNMSVSVLHCRYDLLPLGAMLGRARASRLAAAPRATHVYMTGD